MAFAAIAISEISILCSNAHNSMIASSIYLDGMKEMAILTSSTNSYYFVPEMNKQQKSSRSLQANGVKCKGTINTYSLKNEDLLMSFYGFYGLSMGMKGNGD
jgi:hypothetical protein